MANKFTKRQVMKAIEGSSGIMSTVMKKLGLKSWDTARIWVNKWPETQKAFGEFRQQIIDSAESTVILCMKSPDEKVKFKASTYLLDRLGRERGYGEHIDANIKNPDGLTVKQLTTARKGLARDIAKEVKKLKK